MTKDDCYELGIITKTHGLLGGVILHLDVDYPDDYHGLDALFIEGANGLEPYFIEDINIQGQKAITKLEGIDTIEATEVVIKKKVFLPLEALPKLDGNKFYYHEVTGFMVKEGDKEIGAIESIIQANSHALIRVLVEGKEVLIPLVDEFIEKVDKENKEITLMLPEGLLDVYLSE